MGHSIAGGENLLFDDSAGTLTIERLQPIDSDQGYSLFFAHDTQPGVRFRFKFAGPDNEPLAVGQYLDAKSSPESEPGIPLLNVSGQGSGCSGENGEFEIKEIIESADRSTLLQFAVDLTFYCRGTGPPLNSSIRVNSALPLWDGEPNTIAGADITVAPAESVQLDGSASQSIDGSVLTYDWSQVNGIPVLLNDPTAVAPVFTAPNLLAKEYEFLEFQLTTTDTSARSSSDKIVVTVTGILNRQSLFNMETEDGHLGGPARTVNGPLDLASANIQPGYPSGVGISYMVGPSDPTLGRFDWGLVLRVPEPNRFAEGFYYNARGGEASATIIPIIGFAEAGSACSKDFGNFVVREAAFAPNGGLDRLAVDFIHRCAIDGPALTGILRIDSVVPVTSRAPTAAPGPDWIVFSGDTVTLDGQLSTGGLTPIASHFWQQTSGQSVTLTDNLAATNSFPAPLVNAGEGEMEFELTVANDGGYSDTEAVTITVQGPDDPKKYVRLIADPVEFDFVLGNRDHFYTENNSSFIGRGADLGFGRTNGIDFRAHTGDSTWRFSFAPRSGEQLLPGVYLDTSNNVLNSLQPYFRFSGEGRECSLTLAEFVIHELDWNPDGSIQRLAIDFRSQCADVQPAEVSTGIIRFNSTVPDIAPDPIATISGNGTVLSGTEVILDSSGSYGGAAGIVGINWQQIGGPTVDISDPNSAQLIFTPNLSGSAPIVLQFQVTITTVDGLVSTAIVAVTVIPDGVPFSAIAIESEPGDPIGGGRSVYLDVDDVEFGSRGAPVGQARIYAKGTEDWDFDFESPFDDPLLPGNYEYVFRPGQVPSFPGMSITGNHLSCIFVGGRFVVYEAVAEADFTVSSLAVDFEQYCDFRETPLRGSIRFNSAVPLKPPLPNAAAGRDVTVAERTVVPLQGSNSTDADGQIVSYLWEQLSGPGVNINDITAQNPDFVAPDIPTGGDIVELQLTVIDNDGNSDTDTVKITVLDDLAPRNLAFLHQEARPFPELEGDFLFDDNSSYFRGYELSDDTVRVDVVSILEFGFAFTPTLGSGFIEGRHYEHTNDSEGNGEAFMELTMAGTVCNSNGWFEILELQKLGDEVISLAADYEQICTINVPPFVGSIRFNSAIPYRADFVAAYGGRDEETEEGLTVVLDGGESFSVSSNIVRHSWRVVNGPDVVFSGQTPTASFVAPPIPVSSSPIFLTIELEIEDASGATNTDEIVVRVGDNGIIGFPDDMLTRTATNQRPFGISVSNGDLVYNEYRGTISGGDPNADPDNMHYGLWLLRIKAPSGIANLTLHSLEEIEDGTRWVNNSITNGWQEHRGTQSIAADRLSITIGLTDGGADDLDGVVNGIVEISGGPGVFPVLVLPPPPQPPPKKSGGGGSTNSMLLIFLALFSIWRKKRKSAEMSIRALTHSLRFGHRRTMAAQSSGNAAIPILRTSCASRLIVRVNFV